MHFSTECVSAIGNNEQKNASTLMHAAKKNNISQEVIIEKQQRVKNVAFKTYDAQQSPNVTLLVFCEFLRQLFQNLRSFDGAFNAARSHKQQRSDKAHGQNTTRRKKSTPNLNGYRSIRPSGVVCKNIYLQATVETFCVMIVCLFWSRVC